MSLFRRPRIYQGRSGGEELGEDAEEGAGRGPAARKGGAMIKPAIRLHDMNEYYRESLPRDNAILATTRAFIGRAIRSSFIIGSQRMTICGFPELMMANSDYIRFQQEFSNGIGVILPEIMVNVTALAYAWGTLHGLDAINNHDLITMSAQEMKDAWDYINYFQIDKGQPRVIDLIVMMTGGSKDNAIVKKLSVALADRVKRRSEIIFGM